MDIKVQRHQRQRFFQDIVFGSAKYLECLFRDGNISAYQSSEDEHIVIRMFFQVLGFVACHQFVVFGYPGMVERIPNGTDWVCQIQPEGIQANFVRAC